MVLQKSSGRPREHVGRHSINALMVGRSSVIVSRMTSDSDSADLGRVHSQLEAAIGAFMDSEANAVRADDFDEATRFQAAIPHLQRALVSLEGAIAAAESAA
ncbi:hypothetical protein [Naasia lichenicola]|uniref:Uncharacterized protein n=1 Tax=Naasia lichenicola TaxID=2565933 RepID=A0A4S4FSW4_9MICO|nr:hypothetical protein [Naasia lichenicola]THG33002.1 hypothetical protein E6C64_01155 [Naasia lichenicola]